jgi:hypothetical protein
MIALGAAVTGVLVGFIALSQARSARRQAALAESQVVAAQEQVQEAQRQASAAERQSELLREQNDLLKEQLSADRAREVAAKEAGEEAAAMARAAV